MKKNNIKKRFITLVEMMIVMFLIAMITGVIAFNYTGSLEEGKAFKTKSGIDKIHTILDLHLAAHPNERTNIESSWKGIVAQSQLVKNAKELINDGWGQEFKVEPGQDGDIVISSQKYSEYLRTKGKGSLFKDDNG